MQMTQWYTKDYPKFLQLLEDKKIEVVSMVGNSKTHEVLNSNMAKFIRTLGTQQRVQRGGQGKEPTVCLSHQGCPG
jgi:hypothetical protein